MIISFIFVAITSFMRSCYCQHDVWENIPCNVEYQPENCDFDQIPLLTVEDFDRCAPALLNLTARNYFLAAAGRRITYNDNFKAYRRYRIVPKLLRDVSRSSLEVTTLGQTFSFPVGNSPTAVQKLAHPLGEIATVRAISNMNTVMIMSSSASTTIEDLANAKNKKSGQLWLQTYIYKNRSLTVDMVTRAERAGFKAIVLTIDYPVGAKVTCNGRESVRRELLVNLPPNLTDMELTDKSITYRDLTWLREITSLPIVAKGVLSGTEARMAIYAGASAILVSNHGGRQLDSDPATIDVLSDVVRAVKLKIPRPDVYVDGGVRNGWDVYKAIGRGAKMVFVGRPIIWGLAEGGQEGVEKVLSILKREFEEAMLLSGSANPSQISKDSVIPAANC